MIVISPSPLVENVAIEVARVTRPRFVALEERLARRRAVKLNPAVGREATRDVVLAVEVPFDDHTHAA